MLAKQPENTREETMFAKTLATTLATTLAATLAALAAGLITGPIPRASAEPPATPLKIGLIGDFQSVYSDIGGPGNVEAAKMAIEEFGGTMFGKPIELITADAQNKADIAGALARKWYEVEGVDMI